MTFPRGGLMACQLSVNITQKQSVMHKWASPLIACPALLGSQLPSLNTRYYWGNRNLPKIRNPHRPNKHKLIEFAKYRRSKTLKVELPDHEYTRRIDRGEESPDEMRAMLKKRGMLMPRQAPQEAPMFLGATGAIIDEYQPPAADGYAQLLTKEGAKKQVSSLTSKGKTFRATRKIRQFDDEFDPKAFGSLALETYIKAHKALAGRREKELLEHVTEKVYPEMLAGVNKKTMYWDFVKSLEPPRTVHVRCEEIISKGNSFAQVTVRFHTQQILAVYDRFGRLIHGHPHVAKDVLEYVTFEKHLANYYGKWRLHGKIIPDWLSAQRPSSYLTQVITEDELDGTDAADEAANKTDKVVADRDDEEDKVLDQFGRPIRN